MEMHPFLGFWKNLPRPFAVLAPMEDVTDWVFRTVIFQAGRPEVFFTEFVNASAIQRGGRDAMHRLPFSREHRPLVTQIWGKEPEDYYKSVLQLRAMGVDGIDINMGCPQPKIAKKGACAGLIRNPSLAAELIQAAQEAASTISGDASGLPELPVSVKTRIGWKEVETESWIGHILSLKPAALTVHARTAEQMSEGDADWTQVQTAVELRDRISPETLIIGNGDIKSAPQAFDLIDRFAPDGAMVGRGIFYDPFIFREFRRLRESARRKHAAGNESGPDATQTALPETLGTRVTHLPRSFPELPGRGRIAWARRHLDLFEDYWGRGRNYEIMKKFFKLYIKEFDGAEELRAELMETHDFDAARLLLSKAV